MCLNVTNASSCHVIYRKNTTLTTYSWHAKKLLGHFYARGWAVLWVSFKMLANWTFLVLSCCYKKNSIYFIDSAIAQCKKNYSTNCDNLILPLYVFKGRQEILKSYFWIWGSGIWQLIASYFSWPVAGTHCIIFGLLGFTVTAKGKTFSYQTCKLFWYSMQWEWNHIIQDW